MDIIRKFLQKIEGLIGALLDQEVSMALWASSFLGITFLRVLEERFFASNQTDVGGVINGFLYNFFFFIILFLIIWLLLSFVLEIRISKLSGVILWSFWLVLLPPVLDMIKTGGGVFWSFYALGSLSELWKQFITLFGDLPSGIMYFGAKIGFVLAIIFVAGLILIRTRNVFKMLLGALATYVIIFFLGTLPSWLTIAYYFFQGSKKITQVNEIDAVQFFGRPYPIFGLTDFNLKFSFTYNLNIVYFLLLLFFAGLLFFIADRRKFWAVLKNVRLPQMIYHAGLFFIGMGLGWLAYPQNFNLNIFSSMAVLVLLSSIWLAWNASVVVNDLYDCKIDEVTNRMRPLPQHIFSKNGYRDLGMVLFLLSLIGGLVIGLKFAALLLIYQIIAWFYSAEPYRLKRFPAVATFVSALASVMVLIIGFSLFSGADNIAHLSWRLIIMFLFVFTLSLPIKDFKDIEGDRKDGVWTIPVMFGDDFGRTIVAVGVFISFLSSPFFLNEFGLFWWALLFGGGAYLIITRKTTKSRRLFWWMLGFVTVYGFVIVKTLFLK